MSAKVQGYCPMGCGDSLFLGSAGYVTCSLDKCPNPGAASDILSDRETEHIVEFRKDGYTIQHPLRERLEGSLFDCPLGAEVSRLSGTPVALGRYRLRFNAGFLAWEQLPRVTAR